jgi:mRNA interferase RelE/StbE
MLPLHGSARQDRACGPRRSGDVRLLKGTTGCRLRIGDWRVIFIEDARSLTVVAVDNRKEIYD